MHVGDDRRDDSTSNPSARYTDEFRRETADYIISTGRPITQCRSELGLNSNTVRKWSRTAAASSWVTSRICAPARGGSACPRSSTRTPTWWWAGRSPRDLTADIAVSTPASAKSRGYVAGNAIFHADRGAQHSSRLLSEWARDNDMRLTCSRAGNCHDNAVAESFFATLKNTDNGNRAIDEGYRRKCA